MLEIRRSSSVSIYFFSNMRYTFVLQQCNSLANQAALRLCCVSTCFIAWPMCISKVSSIKKGVNCSFICLFISRLRPSYPCTTRTNQFTPQRELRLVILVHEIWSYFEKRIKSVKLKNYYVTNILYHIICFCFVKIEIKCEFGRKKRKNWMTRRVV